MTTNRKLAAIMFTDIAGYTALMQSSEQKAVRARQRHRDIFEPTTHKHHGKIIQYYGDGTLSIFESTVAAVQCAIELQRAFSQEPTIPVRIGIHTGEIILTDDDIIGDAVNLASRIESLGVPGSVLVSGKVAEEIKNQDNLSVALLGTFHLKNDSIKRDVYAIDMQGLAVPELEEMEGKLENSRTSFLGSKQKMVIIPLALALLILVIWAAFKFNSQQSPRLAVLPFFNRLNSTEQNYVVDGVHEALISELQQAGIAVKARTSMMRYRDSEKSIAEIATELNVSALIEGSVLRADDTISINIRLIDGKSEVLLWNTIVEKNFKNVTALYREVTGDIAREINLALTPRLEARLKKAPVLNPEAYKAYLKGQQYWYSLTREALNTSLQYFELAKEIDPRYAPAYSGIASVWGGRLQQGFVSYAEASPFIKEANRKALSLDSELPEVQFWQATSSAWWEWNWADSQKAYKKCLQLNPNYAEAHAYYSHFLLIINRPQEAIEHLSKAIELDPFNPLFQALYGMTLNFSGRHNEAITLLNSTLETSPNDPVALSALRTSYHLAGEYEEAIEIWKRFYNSRMDTTAVNTLIAGYSQGSYPTALELLAELLIERSKTQYVTPWQIATLYTRAGKNQKALDWLEKAHAKQDPNTPSIGYDPIFKDLKPEPRFQKLLNALNLP